MEKEVNRILERLSMQVISLDEARAEMRILGLFDVVGQSEQFFCDTCKNKKSIAYWHETGMGLKPCHCTETK